MAFSSFLTQQKTKNHFVASRRRWLESQGKKATKQESWQNEWHEIEYQGEMAKAPPCPERTLKMPMPQQSSPSPRDEESQWVAVEDTRRRRVAFGDCQGYTEIPEQQWGPESERHGFARNRWECLKKQVSPSCKLPSKQETRTANIFL